MDGVGGDVTVDTTRGDIKVAGGSGFISLKSVQGEITLEKAKGRVDVRAVNQGIHLADVAGDVTAETTNGSIIVDRADSANVDLYTVNGDLSYDGPIKEKGIYRLTTHNGMVAVALAERVNAVLTVRTYNGSFRSTFPLKTEDQNPRKRFSVTLGNGSAHVELESFGGTIALRRPGEPRPETERRRPRERGRDRGDDHARDIVDDVRIEVEREWPRVVEDLSLEFPHVLAAAEAARADARRGRRGVACRSDADADAAPRTEAALTRVLQGSPGFSRFSEGFSGFGFSGFSDNVLEVVEAARGPFSPRLHSGSRSSNSAMVRPVTGSRSAGAISASGSRTKRRSRNRGWGTCRPGSSTIASPNSTRSRSSVRGACT
jgi:hypothetical protein